MFAWSKNSIAPTPMLLMGSIEAMILFSSVYVAGIFAFGSVELCESQFGPLAPRAVTIAGIVFVCMIAMGLYQFHQRMKFRETAFRVVLAVLIGSTIFHLVYFLLPITTITSELSLFAVAYSIILLLVVRFGYVRTVDRNIFRRRTLVYGAGQRAASIGDLRRKADRRGFQIVARVAPEGDKVLLPDDHLSGHSESVLEIAERSGADEIVVAMDDRRGNLPVEELLEARLSGIQVIDLMEFLERETGKIRVDLVNPGWLIFSSGFRTSKFSRFCKRLVDLIASGSLLIFTFPLIVLIALAIKLEEGPRAPVFYRQIRVGRYNIPFTVLKFRSMREDAEIDGKAVWASAEDDRITAVGRLLRVTRLDELPQIVNVFKGQMSFVGPRPERPEFVDRLKERIPYYSERHTVAPGITGWAQLRYGYGASEEDAVQKLQYDLYYVKNNNLLLDVIIILQTVEVVLWGKGAR